MTQLTVAHGVWHAGILYAHAEFQTATGSRAVRGKDFVGGNSRGGDCNGVSDSKTKHRLSNVGRRQQATSGS